MTERRKGLPGSHFHAVPSAEASVTADLALRFAKLVGERAADE